MLTLVVPGLIWPRQALVDLSGDLPLPAFSVLLGRGRLRDVGAAESTDMLAAAMGIDGPLPAAALRRLAFGHTEDGDDWLCLDPVRMRFEDRSLVLDDPHALALDSNESTALAAALAPIFASLGDIVVLAPHAWNLQLKAGAPEFPSLPASIGRSVAPLPVQTAYTPWRKALNEAQMVLHAHEVNRAREAAGRPVVNSLWPWGGGRLPESVPCRHDQVWSADPVIQGLAQFRRAETATLPATYAKGVGRSPLVAFDELAAPARLGDALAWRDALGRLESGWLGPVLAAMRGGHLDELSLLAPGERNSVELLVRRSDLWKFWRKQRSPADVFAANPA